VRERGPSIDIGLLHRRKDANPAIALFARIVEETVARGDGAGTVVRERPPAPPRKSAAKRVRTPK
jgi:hypothetical protein